MAQPRMVDCFKARKRNADVHPSKRRKVQRLTEFDQQTEEIPQPFTSPPISARTRGGKGLPTVNISLNTPAPQNKVKAAGPKSTAKKSTRVKKPRAKGIASGSDIRDVIKNLDVNVNNGKSKAEISIGEEATAACDDHTVSPPGSPTKRSSRTETSGVGKKRSKHSKTARKDLLQSLQQTPEGAYDFAPYAGETSEKDKGAEKSVRKKLVLQRKDSASDVEKDGGSPVYVFEGNKDKATAGTISKGPQKKLVLRTPSSDSSATPAETSKSATKDDANKDAEVPAPETQDTSSSTTTKPQRGKTKSKVAEPAKEQPAVSKEVQLKALDPAAVKSKLAKCGKLQELKEQLAAFSKAAAKSKPRKQAPKVDNKDESKVVEKIPESTSTGKVAAYEKFHSLAVPVPPTLALPYKYKLLAEMFHSMDTVVSMLTKRNEMCTFSKLKAAVQNMMRKAFEKHNVGQIKTVYPEAYIHRQEKGLPMFGGSVSGYQMTIEANLERDENESNTKEKPKYTAAKVLDRKNLFHNSLIHIVKGHHREFLSKLERPLSIPDHKITRWHPKFPLDQVPDVQPAPLPEPPDVKKLNTASDVLAEARGKITSPRVIRALETVAKKSEATTPTKSAAPPKVNSPDAPNAGLKGVPQSLLERIRAKEAQKLEAAMTRSPETTRRVEMISRLPELVRIVRSFFVTSKKPALQMEDVIQKLSDSYSSKMGLVEAENHLKLMIELLPGWLTVVSVKKGTFIKLDKNKDIAVVIDRLDKLKKKALS